MYRLLYGIEFWKLCVILILLFALWCYMQDRFGKTRVWRITHAGLLLLWLGVSLYVTIFSRSSGNGDVNLNLFWSYRIAFIEGSYDYFQQIYLNVVAFLFFGLFAPELLNGKYKYLIVVVFSVILSAAIEYSQFKLGVGLAELDDVLSNTLGTIGGAVVNKISCISIQVIKRWTKRLLRFLHQHTTE